MNYKLSPKGINVLKEFEGYSLTSYLCEAGVWTIGIGHTKGVKKGMKITPQQAETLLRGDVLECEKFVNALGVAKTQNQFDALILFAFNCGLGALKKATFLQYIRLDRPQAQITEQWKRWNKVYDAKTKTYKVSNGLTRRRNAECNLYFSINN